MNPESQQEFPNASELLMCEKYGHVWDDDKCTKCKETRLCSDCGRGYGACKKHFAPSIKKPAQSGDHRDPTPQIQYAIDQAKLSRDREFRKFIYDHFVQHDDPIKVTYIAGDNLVNLVEYFISVLDVRSKVAKEDEKQRIIDQIRDMDIESPSIGDVLTLLK